MGRRAHTGRSRLGNVYVVAAPVRHRDVASVRGGLRQLVTKALPTGAVLRFDSAFRFARILGPILSAFAGRLGKH